ncbi:MAG: hypothetical protein PHN52_09280 [candidate division Zixibacteria bacterium]|nr:hypothetical protein [candidate division Zixibacteria bacterium]
MSRSVFRQVLALPFMFRQVLLALGECDLTDSGLTQNNREW